MDKYIIALDMDGTLLNNNQEICHNTKEYLKYLSKLGHIIVIASGRPFRSIEKYYNEIETDSPCICYNGASIHSKDNSFKDFNFHIDKKVCLDIYNHLNKDDLVNILCENNENMFILKKDEIFSKYFWMKNISIHYGDLNETIFEDPIIMLFRAKDGNEEFKKHIQEVVSKYSTLNLRFWSGMDAFSEIYSPSITKANALEEISKHYSIPRERIIAFGDAFNDQEMLSYAGIGVAMKNAPDKLKEQVKYVTKEDNNHDGIMLFLQDFFKNK